MYFYEYYISSDKLKLDLLYKASVIKNIGLLKKISKLQKAKYKIIEIEKINLQIKEQLLESIRIISRKNNIGVVTKDGSGPLPISRSKNINNNGFLLCYLNNSFINVFPHISNKKRLEISEILEIFYSNGKIPDDNELKEKDILKIIETFPELISNDLIHLGNEVEIDCGRIDCVFKKKKEQRYLLIEIEIYAKSIAIEQCLKFKLGYSKKYNVPLTSIELIIVCGTIKDSTYRAAITCGISIFKLCLKKLN